MPVCVATPRNRTSVTRFRWGRRVPRAKSPAPTTPMPMASGAARGAVTTAEADGHDAPPCADDLGRQPDGFVPMRGRRDERGGHTGAAGGEVDRGGRVRHAGAVHYALGAEALGKPHAVACEIDADHPAAECL